MSWISVRAASCEFVKQTAPGALFDRVESRQPDGEEFSENDAVVQSLGRPKLQLLRELTDADRDLSRIVGLYGGDPVSEDDPVDHAGIDLTAAAASFDHEVGIVRDGSARGTIVMHA